MTKAQAAQIRRDLTPSVALTCTVFGEAQGESILGQVAVAAVIRNRVRHPTWWGKDWASVCTKPWQFACWWEATDNTRRVYALAAALLGGRAPVGPQTVIGQLDWIAAGILDDVIIDPTDGANHYCTTALLRKAPPAWARGQTPTTVIDGHTFFRLR